jgi:nucleoside phosphorylase
MIEDFDPQWLVLVGIGGGFPSDEYTLGDVVVATKLTDFSVSAALEGGQTEYDVSGGRMHKSIEDLLAFLPARLPLLGDWNSPKSITAPKPSVDISDDALSQSLYGKDDWKKEAKQSLSHHFDPQGTMRRPLVTKGAFASSDRLMKDTVMADQWQQAARDVQVVEMELAGVYEAARRINVAENTSTEYPILAVRGISDVVGYKRTGEWTKYACNTSAALAYAFLRTRPIEPRSWRVQEVLKQSIIKRFSEVIAVEFYKHSSLTEWPVSTDLIAGDKGQVYEDYASIEALDRLVCSAAPRRGLLRGAEGRGKTVLSRLLAFQKEQLGWEAFVVDIRLLSTMPREEVDHTVGAIDTIVTSSAKPSLFIFENAHLSDEVSFALIRYIDFAADRYDNLHALFVSRDPEIDDDLNPFRSWKRNKWCLTIRPDQASITGVVRQHLRYKQSSYKLTPRDTDWLEQRFMVRPSAYSSDAGGNLRLLRLYLNVWDDKTTELAQLSEDHINAGLKEHIYFNELQGNEELREQLGKVVSVFQFDVPFYAQSNSEAEISQALRLLGQLSHLVINLGEFFYGLAHSVDAHYIVKCLASIHKVSNEEFTAHRLIRYLRSIIGTVPSTRVSDNIFSLLRNLGLFSSTEFDKSQVFAVLYDEARDLLLDICMQYRLNIAPYVLQSVEKTYDRDRAFQFWRELYGGMPPERWREKIKNSDIRAVASILEKVSKYSKDDGLAFYQSHLQFKSLADADITSFQLITLYLPPEEVEAIVTSLNVPEFAWKAVEGGTLTNLNWAIDHIERAASGPRFLKEMFLIIEELYYKEYRSLFLNATDYRPIENHINHLNKYSPRLRVTIAKDRSIQERVEQLRYVKNKVIGGVRVIKRRYVKNFVGIRKYDSFVSNFNHNFSEEFRLELNNLDLILKLIRTINSFTRNADDTAIVERGRSVIGQIVRALTDEQIRGVCCDLRFLEDLEVIDKSLFDYVNEKCKSVL